MKHILVFTVFITTFLSCQNREETQFSVEALNDELISLQGNLVPFNLSWKNTKGVSYLLTYGPLGVRIV